MFEQVLRRSEEEGLPPHAVSPLQGQLLHQLVVMRGASTVLELGTLGGYSTIWFARAVREAAATATATTDRTPGVVTLEANSHHAAVARDNLQLAKVQDVVTLLEGPALDSMEALAASDEAFDVVFIDADKPNNPAYLHAALKLSRPGTVIIGDNVVRGSKHTHTHTRPLSQTTLSTERGCGSPHTRCEAAMCWTAVAEMPM